MSIDTLLAEVRAECATMLPGATVMVLHGGERGDRVLVDAKVAGVTIYSDGTAGAVGNSQRHDWRTGLAELRAELFRMRRNIDRALWGDEAKPGGGA